MSGKATCVFCSKEDSKNKMVYQLSLLENVEKWFHVKCMPAKKGRKK